MKVIQKKVELGHVDYFKTHLSIINPLLPEKHRFTPMEIEVLAHFMAIEGDLAAYRFGASAKKLVMETLNLKPSGLSNYFRTLLDKQLLRKEGDLYKIWDLLIPETDVQEYRFLLINKKHGTRTT